MFENKAIGNLIKLMFCYNFGKLATGAPTLWSSHWSMFDPIPLPLMVFAATVVSANFQGIKDH
jgi:hypothetical protein